MSGPKGGTYSVEENRRREEARRQALLGELRRAQARLADARAVASGHIGAGVDVVLGRTLTDVAESADIATLEEAIRRTESERRGLVRRTAAAVAAHRAAQSLDMLRSGVGPGAARRATREEVLGAAPARPSDDRLDRARAVLATLEPDAAEDAAEVLALVERLAPAPAADVAGLLDALTDRVRAVNRRSLERDEVRAQSRELLLELVGVAGDVAAELRRRLEEVAETGEGLDDHLRSAVGDVVGRQRRAEDRAFVAEALVESLGTLGYDVGETFVADLLGTGAAEADRPGWAEHAVQVLLPASAERVVLSPVRYRTAGASVDDAGRRRDVEVEEEFCRTFDPLLAALGEIGVTVSDVRRHPPGTVPMEMVDGGERSAGARRKRAAAPRVREADG